MILIISSPFYYFYKSYYKITFLCIFKAIPRKYQFQSNLYVSKESFKIQNFVNEMDKFDLKFYF